MKPMNCPAPHPNLWLAATLIQRLANSVRRNNKWSHRDEPAGGTSSAFAVRIHRGKMVHVFCTVDLEFDQEVENIVNVIRQFTSGV